MEREKAGLALRRVKGRHTADVIGGQIHQVHSDFGIVNKVTKTITDSASNFRKAFRDYARGASTTSVEEGKTLYYTFIQYCSVPELF